MDGHLYCVTAQKSTAVDAAITAYFTSPNVKNLIISKTTRFEIHSVHQDSVQLLHEIPVRGRIIDIQCFRPVNATLEKLFFLTDTYKWAILSYDTDRQVIHTDAHGDFQDRMTRATEANRMVAIDPDTRAIVLHLYTGLVKIIPLKPTEGVPSRAAFDVRIEESVLFDVAFLYNRQRPTLLFLFEDLKWTRHIKIYEVSLHERELVSLGVMTVEGNPTFILPIPSMDYMPSATPMVSSSSSSGSTGKSSVLIIGESLLSYFDITTSASTSRHVTLDIPPTIIKACTIVMDDDTQHHPGKDTILRVLLGDYHGKLYLLTMNRRSFSSPCEMHIDILGQIHIPSSLAYLTNGRLFVGSAWSDSQIIQMKTHNQLEQPDSSYLDVIDVMTNIGPIVDFTLLNIDGQCQMMTCSGTHHDGSLRFIRTGVGFNASLISSDDDNTATSLKKIFPLSNDLLLLCSADQSKLVQTSTFLPIIDSPLNKQQQQNTILYAYSLPSKEHQIVTTKAVMVFDASATNCLWTFPMAETPILHVLPIDNDHGRIALLTCHDIYFLNNRTFVQKIPLVMEPSAVAMQQKDANCMIIAISYWMENRIDLFDYLYDPASNQYSFVLKKTMQDKTQLAHVSSLIFLSHFLLVGYADGIAISYDQQCNDEKRIYHLSNNKITFSQINRNHSIKSTVLACTDRPAVFYVHNDKIFHAGLQLKHLEFAIGNTNDSTVICIANGKLMMGDMDSVQKLHVRTHALNEMPRRMACGVKNKLCVLSTRSVDDVDQYFVRLYDNYTSERLNSYALLPNEAAASITHIMYHGESYFVVGTAFILPQEQEPTRGRLLVLTEASLTVVFEREIHGVPYCLQEFHGKVVAAINSKICIFRFEDKMVLALECAFHGFTVAVNLKVRSDDHLIYVGDMMKSVSVLKYTPCESGIGKLEEVARDYHHRWTTSVIDITQHHMLVGENGFYLYSLLEERDQQHDTMPLMTNGYHYVGEFITKMMRGSLTLIENKEDIIKGAFMYVTSSGGIGAVFHIDKNIYKELRCLEKILAKHQQTAGNISHEAWRTPTMQSQYLAVKDNAILDGDLIESFLNLTVEEKLSRVEEGHKEFNMSWAVNEVTRVVEELARSH